MNQFSRSELIYGKTSIRNLHLKHVCVFGVGGVGGMVCESLVRMGIGEITVIDNDLISLTNLNRQIVATLDSLNEYKVDVIERRLKSINKDLKVNKIKLFVLKDNINLIDFTKFDYIVDAIDTISAKIEIILKANELNIPIISSMGTGNKINPMGFKVSDIYKTKVDPLCKVMRHELKKRNINKLKVVYSEEIPYSPLVFEKEESFKRSVPGSNSFTPLAAGLLISSEVIKDLTKDTFRIEEKI